MIKRMISLLIAVLMIFGMTGCSEQYQRYEGQFLELFDTQSKIVGYAQSKDEFDKIIQTAYDELEVYHQLFDIYNDYPDINNIKKINDNAGIAPVKVDRKLIDLLLFAKDIYELSHGECNVAFGAVLSIWHDYRTYGADNPDDAEIPPMEKLEQANLHTDINKVIIDEEASTIYLEDSEMSLDVGGIAKGYAVERVAQTLEESGVTSLLLNIGGNVRAIGKRVSDNSPWVVGLDDPFNRGETIHSLYIDNISMVTSGDYQRYYTVDGKDYHHIIDKDTLMPLEQFKAVTILYKDSGMSDGITTYLFNVPLEEGMAFIENLEGAEALWVLESGEIKYSSGMDALIKK